MWHAEFKLMLYPVSSHDNKVGYQEILAEAKIIGENIEKNRFSLGDEFLSHFTFMGCSPDIELEPQNNGTPFCYLEIEEQEDNKFVSGSNLKKAKCTHCKKSVSAPTSSSQCPHCLETLELAKINWRKTAFVAKDWITIGNIYELEAIPNDQLLNILETKTGVKWKPAYIRNETIIAL